MGKRIVSLVLCLMLFFADGTFIQAAGNVTDIEDSKDGSQDERNIPKNPIRPQGPNDEWEGDYVYFGKYLDKSLKWRVLKNDGKNLLLITDSGVGCMPYQDVSQYGEHTWEGSSIRQYLNGKFIDETFTKEEIEYLQINNVRNGYSGYAMCDSGNDTKDKVYLLSATEIKMETYGFYGGDGTAKSRRFSHEENGEEVYEEIYTRTMMDVLHIMQDTYPYAWWVDENGKLCGRSGFSHPVTWNKHIHPVIKIPVDCPYWKDETKQEKEEQEKEEQEKDPEEPEPSPERKWSFQGLDFKATFPEDIPVIGGAEIGIDFGKMPVKFSQKDNLFRLAVGLDFQDKETSLWDLEPQEWNKIKKWKEYRDDDVLKGVRALKDTKKSMKRGVLFTPMDPKMKTKVSVRGYVEGTMENGMAANVEGGISIEVSVKLNQEWQTFLLSMPVVVKCSGEVGIKEELGFGLDFDACNVYFDGEVDLTLPKIRVSGGVGVAYIADVSAYGEFENHIKIVSQTEYKETNKKVSAVIKGAIGLSVKALCFSAEYKWVQINNGKGLEWWNSEKGLLPKESSVPSSNEIKTALENVENYEIQRSYVSSADWYPQGRQDINENDSEEIVRTEIYDDPEIKTVRTEDGTVMMVYIDDISERGEGNHTALVYSLWNSETDKWSDPQIIQDDGTADFYPDVMTDGTDIYVAWTNVKRQFSETELDLQEMAKACEISVAKYDAEQGAFAVNAITENEQLDLKPILGKAGDSVGVTWIRNNNSDVLKFDGVNSVLYSLWNGNEWMQETEYVSFEDKIITSAAMGMIEESTYLSFTADSDRDSFTMQDVNLYAGKLEETPQIVYTDNAAQQGIKFTQINDQNVMLWYGDGALSYTSDLKNDYILMQDEQLSPQYQILPDGAKQLVLFVGADIDGKNGTGIFAAVCDENKCSKSVQVTDGESYINGFSGLVDENGYRLVFGKEMVEISNENIEKNVSLCQKKLTPSYKLDINGIEPDEEMAGPGREMEVRINLYNNGLKPITKEKVTCLCNDKIILEADADILIEVGVHRTVTAHITLPEDVEPDSKLKVIAEPVSDDGTGTEPVSMEKTFGKNEWAVYIESEPGENVIEIQAANESEFVGNAVLLIRSGGRNGEVIKEYDIKDLEGGERYITEIKKSDIFEKLPENKTLYFEIEADGEELYYSNNNAFCYIGDVEKLPEDEHTHSYQGQVTTQPSCTTDGEETYTCSGCEDFYTETIPAAGHKYTKTTKNPTCTAKGAITYTCTVCKHSYQETIPATGHKYKKTTTKATCTAKGAIICTCTVCKHRYTEKTFPAAGHKYITTKVAAIMNKNGTVTTTCKVCKKKSQTIIYAPKTVALSKTESVYNGKQQKPKVTVKDSKGKNLRKGRDYTVAYQKNMKKVGQHTVTVKFKGNYRGIKKMYLAINPRGTSLSKATPTEKGFDLKWKKQKKEISGYEIAYSTSNKFTPKSTKTLTVGKGKTSKSITGLKAKKKYYVRIRTYKKVKGKKYCSDWSKAKSVTTKKVKRKK